MKNRYEARFVGASFLGVAFLFASAAHAQDAESAKKSASDGDEGEIIVTAQKRESSIQKVPLSINAVTSATLERSGINTIDSIRQLAPGLNVSNVGSGFVSFTYIRGAGSNVLDAGGEPSVAYFMDEVYLAGTAGLQFDLLDVERVEVLKGPQGTLFGRNAAGGAISIISKRPSSTFDAWGAAEVGNYKQFALRGGLTGPIGDNLSYRVSAAHRQRGSFVDNPAGRDPGSVNTDTVRGQLMYDAANLTVLLSADYFNLDNGMTHQFPTTADTSGLLSPDAAAAQPSDQSFYRRYYDVDGFEKQTAYSTTGRIEWNLGPVELTSITAYRNNQFKRLQDQEGTISDGYSIASDERDETISQEFRLSGENERLRWIAGIYYYNNLTDRKDIYDTGPAYATAALRNSGGIYRQHLNIESYAAFGQLTYEVLKDLKFTVGGRYSHDRKHSQQNSDPLGPTGPYRVDLTPSWGSFDPLAIISYEPSQDLMIYGSYSQGYKSGGFQTFPRNSVYASTTYDPEHVKSYELGFKSQLFDRRLRLNVAAFQMDINDQQILRAPAPATLIVDNAGQTRTRGVDLTVQAKLGELLSIDWSSTYQEARFRKYLSNCSGAPLVCTTDYAGNNQVRSPDFQTSVIANLHIPISKEDGKLTLTGEYFYMTKTFFEPSNNTEPGAYQPAYSLLNGRLTYELPGRPVSVALFVKNLSDTRYFANIALVGPSGIGAAGAPRTYGISLSWHL